MNWKELTDKLVINKGDFTLVRNVLTEEVNQWLHNYFPDETLVISCATKDEQSDKVIISGKIKLLGIDDCDCAATFSLNSEGSVIVVLELFLDPQSWSFDQSFPDIWGGKNNAFKDIEYSKCSLLLSDMALKDYDGIPLYEGYNFSGVISSSPLMTLLEDMFQIHPRLYGHITLIDKQMDPLDWGSFPFDDDKPEKPLPGFVFKADLAEITEFNVGDYVNFNSLGMILYSPPSEAFAAKNPTYCCKDAFVGKVKISVGNTENNLNCRVNYVPGYDSFETSIDTDIHIGDLEELASFCGGNKLHDYLPDAIKAAQLDKLKLERFCIDFNVASGVPELDGLMLTVSLDGVEWKILNDYTITGLESTFTYEPGEADEDGKGGFGVSISGVVGIHDFDIAVCAEWQDDFTLYLDTKDDLKISLEKYLGEFWPAVKPPSDLYINNISAEISSSNYVEVLVRMASGGEEWIIPVGTKELKFSDILMYYQYQFSKEQNVDGNYSGFFSGTIAFPGDFRLKATCALPFGNDLRLLMYLPDFSLRQLLDEFFGKENILPGKFDITLTNSMIMFQKKQSKYGLKLATLVNDCAFMTFELMDDGGSKGFIFGVNIDGDKLSNLFDMWDLSFINRVFKLDQLALVASTVKTDNYEFPGAKEFKAPALQGFEVNNPGAGKLEEGLTFMAAWKIDTTHQEQAVLAKLLDINAAMAVYMHLGTGNKYKLYAELDSKICGYDIRGKVGARYESPEFAFFIEGEIEVPIQKHEQKFKFDLAFSNLGAFGSGSMKSTQPVDFGCFKLGNLAVQLGISWEMVPSFGLTGIIGIKSFQSSIAVLFDSGNPARSMIAGSVSQLTLKDVFDVFLPEDCESKRLAAESINDVRDVLETFGIYGTGSFKLPISKAEEFNNADLKAISNTLAEHKIQVPNNYSEVFYSIGERDKSWFITVFRKGRPRYYEIREKEDPETLEKYLEVSKEAQFYVVPESTRIGAFDYEQGFYINGMLKMNKFSIEAEVEISEEKFMVHAKMSKVYLGNGILCIAGVNEAHTGPSEEGPELIIQTDQEPYAYLDAYISFLSVESKWKAIVNQYGFSADFGIKGKLGSAEVAATLIAKERFSAHMELALNPFFFETLAKAGKVFGDFELKFGASASVSFEIGKTGLSIKALAVFRINEFLYRTPEFKLEATPKDIEELASLILDKIKERLLELLDDPVEFAKMVLEGFLVIVGKLEDAIVRLYKKTVEEVEKIVAEAKEAIERFCTMEKATEEM